MEIFARSKNTSKYIDITISGRQALQYSFVGLKNGPGRNFKRTNVAITYMTTADTGTPFPPWVEQWYKELGDISVPPAPWLGFKITAIIHDRLFVAIGNRLVELDQSDGGIKSDFSTGNTVLRYILPMYRNRHLIVLNNYYEFSHESNKSNLACYDLSGKEIWRIKLPIKGDVFTGVWYNNEILTGYSWNGYNHKLNPDNGAILETIFTK